MKKEPLVVMVSESPPTEIYRCGVGIVIETLLEILHKAGWRAKWIYPGYPERQGRDGEATLYSVKIPGQKYRIAWFLFSPLGILNFLKVLVLFLIERPDLVILNGTHQAARIVMWVCKLLGIPAILHLHTMDEMYIDHRFPAVLRPLAKLIQRKINLMMASFANERFFPSYYYAKLFCQSCGYKGSYEVRPSLVTKVPGKRRTSTFRKDYRIPNGTRVIMSFSRISREKNSMFLIDVLGHMKTLVETSPKGYKMPILVLAGGGDEQYLMEIDDKAKEKGVEKYYRVTGEYEHPRDLVWAREGDAFGYPSTTDTQCLGAGEAMQCGPTYAVQDKAISEFVVVKECILPEDAEVWAKEVLDVLHNRSRAARIAAQQKRIASRYTNKAEFTRNILAKYREVMSMSKPS